MTDKERIAELEKEKKKLLESVEGATAMYKDLQEARMRIAKLEAQKAGRPQWHKVADGDLPKDCGDGTHTSKHVWVQFKSGNTGVCYYDWDLLGWFANGCPEQLKDILAWCEIPEYTQV